jgi:hypothetical protein
LEVSGCTRGGGGTAAGANVFREFCRIRGRVGVITGAVATATSTTLRIPFARLPTGARVLRAFLYRQTYDSTATYLSSWALLGSNLTPTTDFIGTSTTLPVQVARVEFTDLLRAAPAGSDGVRTLPLTQVPNTSSGGFGWWVVYEAPSLPERTVVVYDGMHTDMMGGMVRFPSGAFVRATTRRWLHSTSMVAATTQTMLPVSPVSTRASHSPSTTSPTPVRATTPVYRPNPSTIA